MLAGKERSHPTSAAEWSPLRYQAGGSAVLRRESQTALDHENARPRFDLSARTSRNGTVRGCSPSSHHGDRCVCSQWDFSHGDLEAHWRRRIGPRTGKSVALPFSCQRPPCSFWRYIHVGECVCARSFVQRLASLGAELRRDDSAGRGLLERGRARLSSGRVTCCSRGHLPEAERCECLRRG